MKKYQIKTTATDVVIDLSHKGLETELLYGEIFIGEEKSGGVVQGHCEHDNYPGWVKRDNLSTNLFEPTHIVNVAHTLAYAENNMEEAVLRHFAFASKVQVTNPEGRGKDGEHMSQLSTGEWVMSAHLCPIHQLEKDIAKTAMKFLNVPYHWGGRNGYSGIDCSGLVQICLERAGVKVPRNASQQLISIGTEVDKAQRGDLVFFGKGGHVGIMLDDTNIINAIGDRPRGGDGEKVGMITRMEKLEELAKLYDGGIKAIKRPKL